MTLETTLSEFKVGTILGYGLENKTMSQIGATMSHLTIAICNVQKLDEQWNKLKRFGQKAKLTLRNVHKMFWTVV